MFPAEPSFRRTAALGGASVLDLRGAYAQEPEKPAEIIVRAWGGSWVDSLKAGVSDSFTKMTGIAVRHDLTEDNEIQPKVWAAVAQKRVPPIHINWDTTTNATKSALRGVTEDLSDLPNLANVTDLAKPAGLEGFRSSIPTVMSMCLPIGLRHSRMDRPSPGKICSTRSSRAGLPSTMTASASISPPRSPVVASWRTYRATCSRLGISSPR